MSPDPAWIWWNTPLGLERTFRAGVYGATSWASRALAELSVDYSMQALCPDGKCMFVEKLDSTTRCRLDLDGTLTVVPYQEFIGTFTLP